MSDVIEFSVVNDSDLTLRRVPVVINVLFVHSAHARDVRCQDVVVVGDTAWTAVVFSCRMS